MANPDWDTILTTTLQNRRKTLVDNIFNARPLMYWLTEKGKTKRMESGGESILEHLLYGENSDTQSYSEWEALTLTPQTGITSAQFPWKQVYTSVVISGLEEAKNNSEERVIHLLEAKVNQSEQTLKNKMTTMLYGDGTGNDDKDFLGLEALIGDDTVGPDVVGGIDCTEAGNEWWRSVVKDADGTTSGLTHGELVALLTRAYHEASDSGSDKVDALFTDLDTYEFYESGLLQGVRYTDSKAANLGFDNVSFRGVPVFWDFDNPAGTVYGINSKYLNVVGHSARWFTNSPFSQGLSSSGGTGVGSVVDARYSFITAFGNMTVSNRRRHFKVYDIVAE
jgi:hypothetical protein